MQLQRALQCLGQPFDGNIVGPRGPMRARAEAAINRPIRVEQEGREGLVIVILEQRQVQAVGRNNADADKFLQQRPDPWVLIDQVVVELDAFLAGNAPQDDQQRLAGCFRLSQSLG